MVAMQTRFVFMGSPEFALPTLRVLDENFDVVGVVTQPDRPAGRGRKLKSPPVKSLAEQLGIPFIQPIRLSEPEALQQLAIWAPQAIIVAAFGQILRANVLDLPPLGCINIHASLLPRWRGAAPIQAAILHGDHETGITIMKMDPGLDTGPIISQRSTPITASDTAGTLSDRLAHIGAELLIETLPRYLSGEITPSPQDESLATLAPSLKKSAGELDFTLSAEQLARKVRAFNPWPGTYTTWQGHILKVHAAQSVNADNTRPGFTNSYKGLPAIETSDGLLVLDSVQPAGKSTMTGEQFLRGARGWLSDHLASA